MQLPLLLLLLLLPELSSWFFWCAIATVGWLTGIAAGDNPPIERPHIMLLKIQMIYCYMGVLLDYSSTSSRRTLRPSSATWLHVLVVNTRIHWRYFMDLFIFEESVLTLNVAFGEGKSIFFIFKLET